MQRMTARAASPQASAAHATACRLLRPRRRTAPIKAALTAEKRAQAPLIEFDQEKHELLHCGGVYSVPTSISPSHCGYRAGFCKVPRRCGNLVPVPTAGVF
jgi:hypothetical protein